MQEKYFLLFVNFFTILFRMRNPGQRIRTIRNEKSITLPALAERAGLSKGLLSKLENEVDSNPSLDTLHKIAEALEVTLADLLEIEKAQLIRVLPQEPPVWLKELSKYLHSLNKTPDEHILNAMYVLRNRKGLKPDDFEGWKFLYLSIEKSFKH